jgi:beta-lactamase regulating signal transducer with metallopeptidase domain
MGPLIISLLWMLIYAIILCGVVWLVLYGVKAFIYKDFPPKLEQGIWFIVLILILIAFVSALTGAGPAHVPWR